VGPPHLIKIPIVDAFTNRLELRGRLPDSDLVESALKGECEGLNKAELPKPRVLPKKEVLSAGNGKSSHETFAASKTLGRVREVPWTSNLLTELQRERKERLFSLVDPHHVLQREQFAYDLDKDVAFWSRKARPVEQPVDGVAGWCQMPLSRSASCEDCVDLGTMYNCPKHMKQCNAPAWHSCASPTCLRLLCWEHTTCYCTSGTVGHGGAAERERKRVRETNRRM
jgi:hypothetical protein